MVAADEELTVDGGETDELTKNKWNVTVLLRKLAKCSEDTARDCTTQETFLWPLHLRWKCMVALSNLSLPPHPSLSVTSPV